VVRAAKATRAGNGRASSRREGQRAAQTRRLPDGRPSKASPTEGAQKQSLGAFARNAWVASQQKGAVQDERLGLRHAGDHSGRKGAQHRAKTAGQYAPTQQSGRDAKCA
jgi:hypothetical protein